MTVPARLVLATTLAAALVGPAAAHATTTPVAAREKGIRQCVNTYRAAHHLHALTYDRSLARAARRHADDMRRQGFFSHTDPQGRGPAARVKLYTDAFDDGVGENIYGGARSAAAACRGWMRSPGHRRNILDPDYAYIGTGFAAGGKDGTYYVQDFGVAKSDAGASEDDDASGDDPSDDDPSDDPGEDDPGDADDGSGDGS